MRVSAKQSFGQFLGKVEASIQEPSNRLHEDAGRIRLREITHRSCSQRHFHKFGVVVRREYQDANVGRRFHDLVDQTDSRPVAQRNVQHDNRRTLALQLPHRLDWIRCLSTEFQSVLIGEDFAESVIHDRLIVNNEDSRRHGRLNRILAEAASDSKTCRATRTGSPRRTSNTRRGQNDISITLCSSHQAFLHGKSTCRRAS